jgi:hypothetical protein
MIVTRLRPAAQGRVPPPVVLHRWPGESSYTDVHLGLFLYRDISLCLLTGVGPQFPHRFPPRQRSPSCRTSSLPERGNLTVKRAPSLRGRSLMAFTHVHGEARAGRDASCAHVRLCLIVGWWSDDVVRLCD